MGTVKRFRTDDVWAEILCTVIGKSFSDINRDRNFRKQQKQHKRIIISKHISDRFSVGCEVGKLLDLW